jgi:hypothetical protein
MGRMAQLSAVRVSSCRQTQRNADFARVFVTSGGVSIQPVDDSKTIHQPVLCAGIPATTVAESLPASRTANANALSSDLPIGRGRGRASWVCRRPDRPAGTVR